MDYKSEECCQFSDNHAQVLAETGHGSTAKKIQDIDQQSKVDGSSNISTIDKGTGQTNIPLGSKLMHTEEQTKRDSEWEQISHIINRKDKKTMNQSLQRTTEKRVYGFKKTVQFSRRNTVIKTTTTEPPTQQLKERGIYMTEMKEQVNTPIQIEFNIDANTREFNVITACQELFTSMSTVDPSVRILGNDTTTVIWEPERILPESDQFRTLFNMREQTFRKGNAKVTIYCIVESQSTINRMKFSDPVKTILLNTNTWIKPDFYSTKVVASPEFFTLVHPKLTRKQDFIKDIQSALSSLAVDNDETVVQEWKNKNPDKHKEGTHYIPKFHIETNLKKWGKIQAEVLNVQCPAEDAQYVKYLLVAASSQGKIFKGLFVPAGIHLIEGKEVLHNLLTEHQEFIQRTTSFQVEGISREEMDWQQQDTHTIRETLSKAPGVWNIEATHQTDFRGQWMLVVNKDQIQQLTDFVTQNTEKIYKNKKGQQPKLFTHQYDKQTTGYKLAMTENNRSTVGTYAEVLTRRFAPTEKSKMTRSVEAQRAAHQKEKSQRNHNIANTGEELDRTPDTQIAGINERNRSQANDIDWAVKRQHSKHTRSTDTNKRITGTKNPAQGLETNRWENNNSTVQERNNNHGTRSLKK